MNADGVPCSAIIGAGLMGRWHADAVRRIGGRVALIVDPDESARTALGRRHPEARLVSDVDPELVARVARVAHVCTPLVTHATLMTALVRVGVHAIVEKPFTDTAESAKTVLSLAEERGVMLCPVHQFLFQHGIRRLLGWLPALGTIRSVEFSTCSAGARGADPARRDDLIGEILPHPLSLGAAILGVPMATLDWRVLHPAAGEFRAVARSRDGVVDVAISANARPTENVLRVATDGGSVIADLFHGYAILNASTISRRAKIARPFLVSGRTLGSASANLVRRAVRREPAYPGLRDLVRQFYGAVAAGSPSPISSDVVLDVATARDQLLSRLSSAP